MNNVIIKIESPITKAALTSTGWNLPENLSETDWAQAGSFLVHVDQARQWWLGDWWNACKWGDGRKACEDAGINYQTAINCGNVASKIQFNRRRLILRFSHHAEVCPIPEETLQDKLLDWAAETGATVKALRENNMVFVAVRGEGIKRLMNDEVPVVIGSDALAKIRNVSRKSSKKIIAADYDALPNELKIKHNTNLSILGAFTQMTRPKAVAEIESAVKLNDLNQITYSRTLDQFKKA